MSPRTKFVHLGQNPSTFGTVSLVVQERTRFGAHLFTATQTNRVDQCLANRLRRRRPVRHQLGESLLGTLVGSKVENSHTSSIRQIVRHHNYAAAPEASLIEPSPASPSICGALTLPSNAGCATFAWRHRSALLGQVLRVSVRLMGRRANGGCCPRCEARVDPSELLSAP